MVETETLTGTTDSQTTAAPKSFTGFEFRQNGSDQQIVAADGSTVVKLYYTRKTYEITFAFGAEGAGSTPLVYKAKYGSVVYAPKLALGGYDFVGFTGYNAETSDGGVIVRGNATYTAEWTERDDTPYRVEHYEQRLSGSGYMLPNGDGSIESLYGTTGATIDTAPLNRNRSTPSPLIPWAGQRPSPRSASSSRPR